MSAYTFSNPITVASGATPGSLSVGGATDNNSTFSGAITLNNNLTVSQVATATNHALTLSGGVVGGSSGPETVTFAGPVLINVSTAPVADNGVDTVAVNVTGGVTTLSGANTHTGGTTVTAGTLNINHAQAIGTSTSGATGVLTIDGGATIDNTPGSPVTLSSNNPLNLQGNFTFAGSNALNLGTGNVNVAAGGVSINVAANTLTIGGTVSGGNLTQTGAGQLVLAGDSTYTGPTSVQTGTLSVAGANTGGGAFVVGSSSGVSATLNALAL